MRQSFQRWINKLSLIVAQPGDDQSDLLRKVSLFMAGHIGVVATLLWVITFFVAGYPLTTMIFAVYAVAQIINIIVLYMTRRFEIFSFAVLFGVLVVPFISQASLGGFVSSGMNAIWSILAPIGAVIAEKKRRNAVYWIATYFALTIIFAALDNTFAALAPPVPRSLAIIHAAGSMIFMSAILFGVVSYFILLQEDARSRADALLLNILPGPIAEQLKREPGTIADAFNEVSVLFADIVDFTRLSAGAEAEDVVNMLNAVFSDFDRLAEKHRLEKIKTIGDAYMIAGGLPEPRPDHAEAITEMALDMLDVLDKHRAWNGEPIRLRIGINTGPVVAGVIGRQKFIYDLWGDAVNTASRMESNGLVDVIQVTETTYQRLRDRYTFEQRDPIEVKGKGLMTTYLLKGRKTAP